MIPNSYFHHISENTRINPLIALRDLWVFCTKKNDNAKPQQNFTTPTLEEKATAYRTTPAFSAPESNVEKDMHIAALRYQKSVIVKIMHDVLEENQELRNKNNNTPTPP